DAWSASALLRMSEVVRATGFAAPEREYERLGGLVLTMLGRMPEVDDQVVLPLSTLSSRQQVEDSTSGGGGWIARVERMDGRRIDRVRLIPVPAEDLQPRELQENNHG